MTVVVDKVENCRFVVSWQLPGNGLGTNNVLVEIVPRMVNVCEIILNKVEKEKGEE